MKIRTDRWHYKLFLSGGGKKDCRNGCVYMACICRTILRAVKSAMKSVTAVCVAALFFVVVGILTVVANLITIPLGFGVALVWFDEDFIQFRFLIGKERKSLARFLVPFWAFVAFVAALWFGFSNHPDETLGLLIWVGKGILWIVGIFTAIVLCFLLYEAKQEYFGKDSEGPVADAWRLAKAYCAAARDGICPTIEFVDPPQHD